MEEKNRFPNFLQSLVLVGMLILGILVAGISLNILNIPQDTVLYTLVRSSAGILIACIPIKYALNKTNLPLSQIFNSFKSVKEYTVPVITLTVGFLLLLVPFHYLLIYLFYSATKFTDSSQFIQTLAKIPFIVIFTPIIEEILFRRIILQGFLNNYNTIISVLLSSILFGVLHIYADLIVISIIAGILFAYLYIKTKSIWICIIAHITTNAMMFDNYFLINKLGYNSIFCLLIGVMLAAIGFSMFNNTLNKKNKAHEIFH